MAQRGPEPKYPWETWQNGEYHTIVQGQHFDCTTETMVQMLHRRASRIGRVVQTRTLNEAIIFAFEGKAEEGSEGK